jgi:hypothetical protein
MVIVLLIIVLSYSLFWIYRSYQIGIKNQLSLVKDWGGKTLNNPEKYRIALALVYLVSALALITTTIILIATKTPLKSWWVLGVLGQCYVIAHNFIAWRAKKNAS